MRRKPSTILTILLLFGWAIVRALWEAIGHFGNFQTLREIVGGLVKNWPSIFQYAALLLTSWWLPLVLLAILIAWWQIGVRRIPAPHTSRHLTGRITRAAYFEGDNRRAGVAIGLQITNTGPTTIVDGWLLRFQLDGTTYNFAAKHFPDNFTIPDIGGQRLTLKASEMIYEKVGTNPLTTGARVSGFLVFVTEGISFDQLVANPAQRLTVFFRDAFGNDYSAEHGPASDTLLHEPGLDDPFTGVLLRHNAQARRNYAEARQKKIKECARKAAKLLRDDGKGAQELWSFNAICRAGADLLDDDEAVSEACDILVGHGYKHPFYGLENHVLQNEWLDFINAATHRSLCLEMSGDYLQLAEQWPFERHRQRPSVAIPRELTVLAIALRNQGIGSEGEFQHPQWPPIPPPENFVPTRHGSNVSREIGAKVVPPRGRPSERVTYEETDQIIEIFRDAPRIPVAVTSISSKAGEEFQTVMERAAWLNDALNKAGVKTSPSFWSSLGSVPDGTNIWWIKNSQNNDMAERVIKAAQIKGLYPKEVQRPVSAGQLQIELMIGRNPLRAF